MAIENIIDDRYEELIKVTKSDDMSRLWEIEIWNVIEYDSKKGWRVSYVNPDSSKDINIKYNKSA